MRWMGMVEEDAMRFVDPTHDIEKVAHTDRMSAAVLHLHLQLTAI
jgi:hypothetical protein